MKKLASSLLSILALAPAALPQACEEVHLLTPNGGVPGEFYGWAVALDQGALAVGAPLWNGSRGIVYLHDQATGNEVGQLMPSSAPYSNRFGASLAMEGGRLLVGAPGSNGEPGAAYVFDVATGTQLYELVASDGENGDHFGDAVALQGDLAVVGAPQAGEFGQAYLFDLVTGTQTALLTPGIGNHNEDFGKAVAVDGGLVLVGAPIDNDLWVYDGVVYQFDATTGAELTRMRADDPDPGGNFGFAVDLNATTIAIGGVTTEVGSESPGAVYLFDRASGLQLHKLSAAERDHWDQFGASLALDDTTLVVGARLDDDYGENSGAAVVFELATGDEIGKLLPSTCSANQLFGVDVAVAEGFALVGAPGGLNLSLPEMAFLFDLTSTPRPVGTSYCGPAVPNGTGESGRLTAYGSRVVSDDCVHLVAHGLPNDSFGMFLASTTQGLVQPPGSVGPLCLGGAIGRYRDLIVNSEGGHGFGIPLTLSQTPTPSGPTAIQPGETWNFQAWYRMGAFKSNFTDARSITFQ